STEVLRRSEVDEATGHETLVAREYAMLDRAGRLQLPAEYTQALGMRDRVALELEPDHIAVRPDDSDHGRAHRSGEGPHLSDVVLGQRRGEDRRAPRVAGAPAPERLDVRLRLPPLEDVDPPGVHQVRGDGEVETARRAPGLLDDGHTAGQIRLTLLRVHDDVPRDDHHVLLPALVRTACRRL